MNNSNYVDVDYQNPHATSGLKLAMQLVSNTPDEEIESNIRSNSQNYTNWLQLKEAHNTPAILIGGGDSINDCIDEIKGLQNAGATVFALNAASQWARKNGIEPDYQVIIDAKEETATLVDEIANNHLFASRCNPHTFEGVENPTLFHMDNGEDIEALLPEERVKRGGYVIAGGSTSVGICALCVAYTQGFREMHVFGYDSSHRNKKSHGYKQLINNNMPTMEIEHGGEIFISSIAMSKQPMSFLIYEKALKEVGCSFFVYGKGLLQSIYGTDMRNLSEKEKYQLMWQMDDYRNVSPGEQIVDFFIKKFKPDSRVIDFGCGTGRAGLRMAKKGIDVLLTDFTTNSRDIEAMNLPFEQCDLTKYTPVSAKYGFCTDVMEHIPTDDVDTVIHNIMHSVEKAFFQISTVDDAFGETIGQPLHLTVEKHLWWVKKFHELGYTIQWDEDQDTASLFYITNPDRREQ